MGLFTKKGDQGLQGRVSGPDKSALHMDRREEIMEAITGQGSDLPLATKADIYPQGRRVSIEKQAARTKDIQEGLDAEVAAENLYSAGPRTDKTVPPCIRVKRSVEG